MHHFRTESQAPAGACFAIYKPSDRAHTNAGGSPPSMPLDQNIPDSQCRMQAPWLVPMLVRGNSSSAVVMIAERAADFIAGKEGVAPRPVSSPLFPFSDH